jgi:hypothetical protein
VTYWAVDWGFEDGFFVAFLIRRFLHDLLERA